MFGKIYESLYKGSLVGAGVEVFAIWPYCISNQRPDHEYGSIVELNPKYLALVIGMKEEAVEKAMGELRETIESMAQGHDVHFCEFGGGETAAGKLRACEDIIELIDARWPRAKEGKP